MSTPTISQLEQMKHALDGSDHKGHWYRNYYCEEPDAPDMLALVGMGMMKAGRVIPGGSQYFHVTDAGKQAVRDWMGPDYNPEVQS